MDDTWRLAENPRRFSPPCLVKIKIITLGHRMPAWVTQATQVYLERMPREFEVELRELKATARQEGRTREWILAQEADEIAIALGTLPYHALDERGKLWTSQELAQRLHSSQQDGESLGFVIGSADGLHPRLLEKSRPPLALSRFTLPHGLARVILVEQLYRATMILKGHPYHRDS